MGLPPDNEDSIPNLQINNMNLTPSKPPLKSTD